MTTTMSKPHKSPTSPLEDPDVRLMLRVREDQDGAFTELVDRFRPRIFSHFVRLLGNRQDCEDCTQEVFLRIYRARKSYEPRAKFITWLFHVTQNVARNAVRFRKRHPCASLDLIRGDDNNDFLDATLSDRQEDPTQPLDRKEIADVVREAVARLGQRQRTAVELHQFKDWTYSEVAQKMEMTPEAAKSLLYRARIQLREHLAWYS